MTAPLFVKSLQTRVRGAERRIDRLERRLNPTPTGPGATVDVPWIHLKPVSTTNSNLTPGSPHDIIWDFVQTESLDGLATINSAQDTVSMTDGTWLFVIQLDINIDSQTLLALSHYEIKVEAGSTAGAVLYDYWEMFPQVNTPIFGSWTAHMSGLLGIDGSSNNQMRVRVTHGLVSTIDVLGTTSRWGMCRLDAAINFSGFQIPTV